MFAAYAGKGDDKNSVPEDVKGKEERKIDDWLSNSSFSVTSNDLISTIQGTSSNRQEGIIVASHCVKTTNSGSDTVIIVPNTPPGSPLESDSSSSPTVRAATPSCSPPPSPTDQIVENITSSESSSDSETTVNKSLDRYDKKSKVQLKSGRRESKDIRRRQSKSLSPRRSRSSERTRRKPRKEDRRSKRRSGSRSRSRSKSKNRSRKDKHRRRSRSYSRERRRNKRQKRSKERRRIRSSSSSSNASLESSDKNVRLRETQDFQNQIFYEDRTRAFGNLSVATLSRPAVAWYHCSRNGLGIPRNVSLPPKKKTLKYRYYNQILKKIEADLTSAKMSKENESKSDKKAGQIQGNVNDVEDELSKVTAKFNQDLAEDPKNIDLWRKYAEFQDVVHQFERVYRQGGGASGARVTCERKLSILDKALKENPMSEELLKERCFLAESVLSSDNLTSQLKTWIGTDPGNLVLWESLIMLSQGSLSTCRVPVVKSLYQEALKSINNIKRGNAESTKAVESKLINLVLHLGLFLRQAGLMELMWSLINVYLEFNLAKLDPTKFNLTSTIADNALTELEEAILRSQLPLPTLWLRVETLRAGTHWVPLPADADCEDPQRLVFPEDVNDLIHPINSPHLTFRLVTVTLTLLKVPILPWRESAARAAGLHPLPWLLDGPEPLYASLLPLGTLEFKETSSLLMDASQLASGPQYLIARPGQDEYIDFLTQVFSSCSGCLPLSQQTYLLVWWLRFYRWLMQLERLGHCKLPRGRKKKMRSAAKDLLRQDCNRSNLLLFKEFALLEVENGSVESAKKVLHGAISALPVTKPVPIAKDRASICSLYRTLVEMHITFTHSGDHDGQAESSQLSDKEFRNENRKKALCLLVSLGRGTALKEEQPSSTDIAAALSKFHHITKEELNKPGEEELDPFIAADVSHLAPTFLVEWTTCHAWLLFLSHSIWKAAAMFESVLSELVIQSSNTETLDSVLSSVHEDFVKLQRESLLEAYVSLLRHHCHETRVSFGVLRDAILRGLKEFPGNLTLAAALADLETSNSGTGMPLWRLSKMFYEFNSAPAYALFVFVMRYRLKQQESAAHNAITLLNPGGPELPDPNIRNRMSTLLKKLTKHPVMRRCPLLWRLRLQFAAAISCEDSDCFRTFYLALEDCPWAKALYMDIVQVLPTQLAQIQDLLVEKELRLHVTPEELEILRVDDT